MTDRKYQTHLDLLYEAVLAFEGHSLRNMLSAFPSDGHKA